VGGCNRLFDLQEQRVCLAVSGSWFRRDTCLLGAAIRHSGRKRLTLRSTIHSKVVQVPLPSITTRIALIGVVERSDAMTQADPRRKANGEAAIRPMRSGIRCSCLPLLLANTVATGSGRFFGGLHSA
jgi:hypothetical protein